MSMDAPPATNLDAADDVSDIKPPPTLAVSENEHRIGPLGEGPRGLLLELLGATDANNPIEARVFDRLGVDYTHLRWQAFDLYWAGDEDVFVEALRDWKRSAEME